MCRLLSQASHWKYELLQKQTTKEDAVIEATTKQMKKTEEQDEELSK